MITIEQKRVNERYFLNMMRMTKLYIWKNENESFMMEDNKMVALTDNGYIKLSQIVRPEFMRLFVEKK
jgi:hypothetical protein